MADIEEGISSIPCLCAVVTAESVAAGVGTLVRERGELEPFAIGEDGNYILNEYRAQQLKMKLTTLGKLKGEIAILSVGVGPSEPSL